MALVAAKECLSESATTEVGWLAGERLPLALVLREDGRSRLETETC